MSKFIYELYEINHLDEDNDEHLVQDRVESAYEAIKACLDPSKRLDYIRVVSRLDYRELFEFSPYATWTTWETFDERLQLHMRAIQVQLNLEVSLEKAAEDLVMQVFHGKRMGI